MPKVSKLSIPVDEYLAHFIDNRARIDMINQRFFKNTPRFFSPSYFDLQEPVGLMNDPQEFVRGRNKVMKETPGPPSIPG